VPRGLPWILWLPVFVLTVSPASPNTKTMTHNIHVTQFVEPKILHRLGCCRQIAFAELLVSLCGSDIEFVQDPLLDETLVACRLSPEQYVRTYEVDSEQKTNLLGWFGSERLVKFQHSEFSQVVDLVAKLAVTFLTQNFDVDVARFNLSSIITPGGVQKVGYLSHCRRRVRNATHRYCTAGCLSGNPSSYTTSSSLYPLHRGCFGLVSHEASQGLYPD
jgi:hypothetical protein